MCVGQHICFYFHLMRLFLPLIKKGSVMIIHSWLVHASNDNLSNKNRYALLCTYIKKDASFRAGNYAKRESFNLIDHG